MIVFISQPMNGKDEAHIKAGRACIKGYVKCKYGDSVIFIDSYLEDYNPKNGCIPMKYLAKSIELLADADLAVFGEGWEKSRGCVIEHSCAVQYGIRVMYEQH